MTNLTDRQLAMLHAPLDKGRVQFLQGNSHLEQWDVRRHLIRVFGFTGWGVETLELECVATNSVQNGDRWKHTVVYRAQVRLTIKDTAGNIIGQWEDGAGGDAINQPHLGDAHDLAMKTALSQALKRCAVNLGDQFGLSLYNDGDTRPVVNWSVAYPKPEAVQPDPPVKGEPTAEEGDMQATAGEVSQNRLNALARESARQSDPVDPSKLVHPEDLPQVQRTVSQALDDAEELTQPAVAFGPGAYLNPAATLDPDMMAAWKEMVDTAGRIGFADGLGAQFRQSFGVHLSQGTTEQYRAATRIMNGEQL